jgi:hypothetical protein
VTPQAPPDSFEVLIGMQALATLLVKVLMCIQASATPLVKVLILLPLVKVLIRS